MEPDTFGEGEDSPRQPSGGRRAVWVSGTSTPPRPTVSLNVRVAVFERWGRLKTSGSSTKTVLVTLDTRRREFCVGGGSAPAPLGLTRTLWLLRPHFWLVLENPQTIWSRPACMGGMPLGSMSPAPMPPVCVSEAHGNGDAERGDIVGPPHRRRRSPWPTEWSGVGTDLAHPRIGSPGRPSRPLRPPDCTSVCTK